MVLQVYADDSDSHVPTVRKAYVVAGYIATTESWARFAAEWEPLLEAFNISRGKSGTRRFKMSEMASRMADVKPFYETIVRHAIGAISFVIYDDELERAKARIWSDNTELLFTPYDDARNLAKRFFVQKLYEVFDDQTYTLAYDGPPGRFTEMLRLNRDKVEMYFDKDGSAEWITDWWEDFIINKKDYDSEVYGTQAPQFLDDEEYLPLQAADFLAWWARQSYLENVPKEAFAKLTSGDFGSWVGTKGPPMLILGVNEDSLTDYFVELFSKTAVATANIYDAKKKPRTEHALYVGKLETRSKLMTHIEWLLKGLRRR